MFLKHVYKGKGKYLRKKSVTRLFQEILEVKKISNVKRIHLHDDNFNYHKKWLIEFCWRYPLEIGIPWSCTVRVDLLTEDIVKMMHDAGCVGVTYGLETHNEHIRINMLNKGLKNKDFEHAARLFNKYNIKQIASIMLNLPGETLEDAFNTLKYAAKLNVYLIRGAVFSVMQKQPIIAQLIEQNYLRQEPEINNFSPMKLEDITINSPDRKRIIRISPFINIMLKFPWLKPIIRLLSYLPIGWLGRGRIFDGYLEMKFMNIPVVQGLRYYLTIRKGFKAYQSLR